MKVQLGTIEVNDDVRRAIAHSVGKSGLATRADVRAFYISQADADLEHVVDEWRNQQTGDGPAKRGGHDV